MSRLIVDQHVNILELFVYSLKQKKDQVHSNHLVVILPYKQLDYSLRRPNFIFTAA